MSFNFSGTIVSSYKYTPKYIYTIAGGGTSLGDGGPVTNAGLNSPRGIYVDSSGNIFFADSKNNRIRFIPKSSGSYYGINTTANYIHTIAGNGAATYGGDGGLATNASLRNPSGVYVDSVGNVFIADQINYLIRFVSKSGGSYYGINTTANYIYNRRNWIRWL